MTDTHSYIITLFSRNLTTANMATVMLALANHECEIDDIQRLSAVASTDDTVNDIRGYEYFIQCQADTFEALKKMCLELANEHGFELTVQHHDEFRGNRKLVCFDMDSTLIEQEVIVELAKAAGIGEQVAAITESAMRGEIDFNESFTKRVALLEGLSTDVLDDIAKNLVITEGAEVLIQALKANGYHTAILSGGFTYFAEYLQSKLGIDEVHANILDVKDGVVTGKAVLPIVDGKKKAEILQNISKEQGLQLQQVVAIGDGANDLQMLAVSGLGIAFRAKPLVKETAKQSISTLGLDGVLCILGS